MNARAVLLALLLTPTLAMAQATDSVTINVLTPPAGITITAPQDAYRGDTITVPFQCVDDLGDPTACVTTWTVAPDSDGGSNGPRAEIIQQSDSSVTVVLLRAGPVTLVVDVARVAYLVAGGRYLESVTSPDGPEYLEGDFVWNRPGTQLYLGPEGGTDVVELCAAGFTDTGRALFVSSQACYDNLAALTGELPPLGGDLIRRASWDPREEPCYVSPPVYIMPELFDVRRAE